MFLLGEPRCRGVACPRAEIAQQASDRGGIKTSGLQLRGFFTQSSLFFFFFFKERKYSCCRITKSLCYKVVNVASAQGWFEGSPRSQVVWRTTRSTGQFGWITKVLSQKAAEKERVGRRGDAGMACRDQGLPHWRGLQGHGGAEAANNSNSGVETLSVHTSLS